MSEAIQNGQRRERRDFPEYIPPLLVKELRQGLRTRGFVIFLILFPLLMAVPFFFYMLLGQEGMEKSVVNVFFWIGLVMVFLLFNPLRALYSVDQEKKTRSDELIMLTRITSSRIVQEKWVSFTLQTILLVLVVLPFFLLRYFLGGVDLLQELSIMGCMFFLSCMLTAMGLWVSGMPLLYRVLYGIGLASLVCTAVPVIVMAVTSTRNSFLVPFINLWVNKPVLLVLTVLQILAAIYIVTKGMLILASRWFAAVSENTSYPLRKLLFGGVAVMWICFLLGLLFSYTGKIENEIIGIIIICTLCLVVFFLVEMIWPAQYQTIYLKKLKKKGGLASRCMPFLLPGWQSAGMGLFTFLMIFFGILIMLAGLENGLDEFAMAVRGFLLVIANIIFFTVVFRPLYKKVGVHSLICFPLIVGFVCLVLFVFREAMNGNMKELFSALPIVCFIDFDDSKLKDVVVSGNYLFISLNFLLFVVASLPFWKKYRKDKAMLKERQ